MLPPAGGVLRTRRRDQLTGQDRSWLLDTRGFWTTPPPVVRQRGTEVCWFTAVNWNEAAVLAIFPGHLVAMVPDFGAEGFAVRLQSRVVARLRGDHESWHQPVVCSPSGVRFDGM